MSTNESASKESSLRMLLLGVWALYALIAFAVNYVPPEETGAMGAAAAENSVSEPAATGTLPSVGSQPVFTRDIYLTFDDGPCENTPKILDTLDSFGAKATFFTVGSNVERYPEYAKEIVRRGSLLACHTYTHDMVQCYASGDAFMNEILQWRQAVTNACGVLPDRICVRFPGGSTTEYAANISEEIKQRLIADGYRWFDWNAGNNDKWQDGNTNQLPDEEYYLQSYQASLRWFDDKPDTPIVFLMHDTEEGTVNILSTVLNDLVNRGYRFRLLDSHPDWNM